jgi:hypothetical protein
MHLMGGLHPFPDHLAHGRGRAGHGEIEADLDFAPGRTGGDQSQADRKQEEDCGKAGGAAGPEKTKDNPIPLRKLNFFLIKELYYQKKPGPESDLNRPDSGAVSSCFAAL